MSDQCVGSPYGTESLVNVIAVTLLSDGESTSAMVSTPAVSVMSTLLPAVSSLKA